ncbi:MAG: UDP-glucose 4-epimerase [Nitrospinales bacterium]|jgi:UDP-glucose 4-epimerase
MDISGHLEGKCVLVTGASGYLASNLAKSLQDIPCTLRRLTRKPTLPVLNGQAIVEDIQGEITEASVWRQAMQGVDIVFHFAGQTSVYVADEDPDIDYRANVLPMLHMLENCKNMGGQTDIIFAGTSTQVGLPETLPVDEMFQDKPITIYDLHKCMAENYLKFYARMGVVRGVTLRLTNVYGPGPRSSSDDRGFLNTMVRRAISGQSLTLYGEGEYVRDYIYVDDVLSAFLLASKKMALLNQSHFVLGSGEGHSISEALHRIADRTTLKTGERISVKSIDPPKAMSPIEERCFVADSESFSSITGWESEISLSEGIDRTLEAFS